jgi:hypothetical protein
MLLANIFQLISAAVIVILMTRLRVDCFGTQLLLDPFLKSADFQTLLEAGRVSDTFTHEYILEKGLMGSLIKFFYYHNSTFQNICYKELLNEYYKQLPTLYLHAGFESRFAKSNITVVIEELKLNIGLVDIDDSTRFLAAAHFDSNQFDASNERVIKLTDDIYRAIENRNFSTARLLIAQVLHVISDFYSHSNWIELGKNEINNAIGTRFFSRLFKADTSSETCRDNCQVITTTICPLNSTIFLPIIKNLNLPLNQIVCPLKYYKCTDNLIRHGDLLVSGYSSLGTLENRTVLQKPSNACGHGGLLDLFQDLPAQGGINKDTGVYLFSSHAHLHLKAAKLAIKHVEHFFDQLQSYLRYTRLFSDLLQMNV